ncbi:MAG: glycoside hydrolase family 20 zincin-like fold domain-containing protein [Bacteroidales bacterium]|nr:glycoside hydrolase family 20 zincin-like fold domain-containing protein [Bacteroidales bacterium]
MKKQILFTAINLILCFSIYGQVKLIPTPQYVEQKSASFEINNNTKIVVHNLDNFNLEQLSNCVEKELGINLKKVEKSKSNHIEFIKTADDEEFKDLFRQNNLQVDYKSEPESYILNITPKSIQVIAQTDAGIFYGLQTLKQIIAANTDRNNIPCLVIYDFPDIPIRAWQDDISRGPIPKMETLKEQIRKMSAYKLNHFTLYIEHVYKLEKHPGIAPEDGITKAQIKELSKYAKKYHVNLIASYQSFGHMEKTLSHPKYSHLAENEHIISPAMEESYDFLQDVYEEIVPAFSSEYFNINCDETDGLGQGKSKSMLDSIGVDGVYLYHINRLNNLLKKYDNKILMWGDIISNHPHIIKHLPKDITVIAWGYHAAENFEYAITPISNTGINFWVAPGVNCWSNIFPDYRSTEINVFNLIRDGLKHNATGVLNTSWDDDGLNFFQNNWHGFTWGAELSWNAPSLNLSAELSNAERTSRYNAFNDAFNELFYGLKEDNINDCIIEFSHLHNSDVRDILKNTRFFEPIFPIHLEYISNQSRDANMQMLNELDDLIKKVDNISKKDIKNKNSIDYLTFAIQQVRFTLNKNLFRIKLYDYINDKKSINTLDLKNEIEILTQELELLKAEYTNLWNKENRQYWLDKNLEKYDVLIDDLNNLEAYCIISPSDNISEKGRAISMRTLFGNLPIYYSINQDTVDDFSEKYTDTIYIAEDVSIKARAINNNKAYGISECNLIYHKGIGKLHALNSEYSTYHPSYDGGGINALLDGKQGDSLNIRNGKWQGFGGQDIDLEIDLECMDTLNSFSMGFFQNTYDWVIFPKQVEIYVKNNLDEEYQLLTTILGKTQPEKPRNLKEVYSADFDNIQTRYIKIIARYYGKLPEWHNAGSSYDAMIFADEIIIR